MIFTTLWKWVTIFSCHGMIRTKGNGHQVDKMSHTSMSVKKKKITQDLPCATFQDSRHLSQNSGHMSFPPLRTVITQPVLRSCLKELLTYKHIFPYSTNDFHKYTHWSSFLCAFQKLLGDPGGHLGVLCLGILQVMLMRLASIFISGFIYLEWSVLVPWALLNRQ